MRACQNRATVAPCTRHRTPDGGPRVVIDRLVPAAVVTVATTADLLETPLFAAEERALGHAVDGRWSVCGAMVATAVVAAW